MTPPHQYREVFLIAAVLLLTILASPKLHAQKPVDWKEPAYIRAILTEAGDSAGLPRGLAHCVAYMESRFIPTARSRLVDNYRSVGLMQIYRKYMYGSNGTIARFSPYTQEEFKWDSPTMSATVGCNYLAYLIDRFGGSVYLGVIAYNFGMTNLSNIERWDDIPLDIINYANNICKNLDNWDESW